MPLEIRQGLELNKIKVHEGRDNLIINPNSKISNVNNNSEMRIVENSEMKIGIDISSSRIRENSEMKIGENSERRIGLDKMEKEEEKEKEKNDKEKLKSLMRKTVFTSTELCKTASCSICIRDKNLKRKNSKFIQAEQQMHKVTDFLEIIKLNKEFKILKYLILNNVQQKCLPFVRNVGIKKDGYEDEDSKELIDSLEDHFDSVKKIGKYIKRIKEEEEFTPCDKKLMNIITPEIKNMIDRYEN